MQRVTVYAVAALLIAWGTWWLVALPRIELAQLNYDIAAGQVVKLQQLDIERVGLIQSQHRQISEITENESHNRELLQTIAGQSRAQSRALQELKRNDETITEYLRTAVPTDLGRLYQRAGTTDPSGYRKQPEVPVNPVRPTIAKPDTDK